MVGDPVRDRGRRDRVGRGEILTGAGRPLLELDSVSRVYGDEVKVYALRDVSLAVRAGDFVSIVGPSGSGKSTMLGLLGCLDVPTDGRVLIDGTDATALEDTARSKLRGETIGFVFQQFHLIPHLTAERNVETALLYRGLSSGQRRRRAREALDRVGLGPRADHRPVQLSGGEQQRVALARAIVTDPLIILADEPTGALDTRNAEVVMEIFADLVSPERALVVVTHDLDVAATAHRRISMRDGEIELDAAQTPTPYRPRESFDRGEVEHLKQVVTDLATAADEAADPADESP